MATKYQELVIRIVVGCLCVCMAPFLGVALIPLLIGAPLAVPALLLAGGGWLGWKTWLLLLEKLNPVQEVRHFRDAPVPNIAIWAFSCWDHAQRAVPCSLFPPVVVALHLANLLKLCKVLQLRSCRYMPSDCTHFLVAEQCC